MRWPAGIRGFNFDVCDLSTFQAKENSIAPTLAMPFRFSARRTVSHCNLIALAALPLPAFGASRVGRYSDKVIDPINDGRFDSKIELALGILEISRPLLRPPPP